MLVVVIDMGLGNIRSLASALSFLGASHVVTDDPATLRNATHVILPGVGAFDAAMTKLSEASLIGPFRDYAIEQRKPVLGVCLGMQLLCEGSEEGELPGLGVMQGIFRRLRTEERHKVPHVGFSPVYGYKREGMFEGVGETTHYYFTHSYALFEVEDEGCNVAVCDHARQFVAAYQRGRVCGVQFHPEKSQSTGLKLITNFLGAS